MDKYIKQLLERFSKVILPKFGAIVIENDETGELMFNEYLNYNDGKLDAIIEKESNMELQDIQNMIAKYIRDIQAQIDKGESYDIFGLGSFSKNKDGEVEFSGNLKTGQAKKVESTAGPSPTPTKKVEEKKVEPKKKVEPIKKDVDKTKDKVTQKKENKYVAPATTPPSKESTDKLEAKSDKKDDPSKKADDSKKTDKVKKDTEEEAEKLKAKKKAEEDKVNAKAKKEKEEAKEEKKNKKTKDNKPGEPKKKKKKRRVGVFGWIIIILLFLAAGGSITAGLYYDEISDYMGWNEFADQKEIAQNDASLTDESSTKENETSEMTDDQQEVNDEEDNSTGDDQGNSESSDSSEPEIIEKEEGENNVEQETEKTTEPVEKVEPEPTTKYTPNTSTGSYHLIAGGFREKSNAEDLVNELNGKGLNAQIIGRINGLHFVSAKSYSSLQAAKQDISNVRSQVPGAWIYKK